MATHYTLEDAILIQVRRTGSCSVDDLVSLLSDHSWNDVFQAVDHLSRTGRLALHRPTSGSIQISLPASTSQDANRSAPDRSIHLCMGCGYLRDKVTPEGGTPLWITGHVFRQTYGYGLSEGKVIEELCPSCAHVIALASQIAKSDVGSITGKMKSEADVSRLFWNTGKR